MIAPGAVDRRTFLRAAAGVSTLAIARSAGAETTFTIGVILPGPSPVTTAMREGALLGLDDANALAGLFGKRLALRTMSAGDAGAGGALGRALTRDVGAVALIGGAGPGFADALRDAAASEDSVFLNVATPDDRLRNERCDRNTFHLAPSVTMYVDALAQWLAGRQRLTRWTVAGDGTPLAREIEVAARQALAKRGGSLVGGDAAADVVLLAGDGDAVRQSLARPRAEGVRTLAGIGAEVPIQLGADAAAGIWSVGWHHELDRFSARELNARFRRRFSGPLGEASWAAWAAVKLVGEAVVRGGAANPAGVRAFLESSPPFDGHKGTALTFRRWDHQLRQPLYVFGPRRREEVSGRRGPFGLLADVPGPDLDAIGTGASDSRCRLTP